MATWSKAELKKIAKADDLHIAPFRDDGKTYGTPTWIWSVAVGDALYVRGYNGTKSRWYQAALHQPRQSARVTHLYSVKVTHTKNTIWNGIRCGTDYGPALSSTP